MRGKSKAEKFDIADLIEKIANMELNELRIFLAEKISEINKLERSDQIIDRYKGFLESIDLLVNKEIVSAFPGVELNGLKKIANSLVAKNQLSEELLKQFN